MLHPRSEEDGMSESLQYCREASFRKTTVYLFSYLKLILSFIFHRFPRLRRLIAHFTGPCLLIRSLNRSEARVDFVMIQTLCF